MFRIRASELKVAAGHPRSPNRALGVTYGSQPVGHPFYSHLGEKNELFTCLGELKEFYEYLLPYPRKGEVFDRYKDNFICSHSNPKLCICEDAAVKLGRECYLITSVSGARFYILSNLSLFLP